MTRTLFALLPESGEGWNFVYRLPTGRLESSGAPQPRDRLVVFVPAESVSAVPVRFGAQLPEGSSDAAVYAIEDELAEAPESVHAVVAPNAASESTRIVYAVSRDCMEGWAKLVRPLQGTVLLVPPQSLCAPEASPVVCGDVCIGWAGDRPVAVDMAFPADARRALMPASDAAPRVSDPLTWLASLAGQQVRLTDLSTGDFARRSAGALALKPYRLAGALAVSVAAVSLLTLVLSLNAMDSLDARLRARAAAEYAVRNPGVALPATIDQARALTAAKPQAAGFRELSARLYLAAEPFSSRIRIKTLRYEAATGQLQAKLALSDMQAGDELAAALKAEDPTFRQDQMVADGGRVEMDITLGAAT